MAGQIGITHPFEEKKEEWTQYVERLEHFFIANGHTNSRKQKFIFLTAIGPTAYKSRVTELEKKCFFLIVLSCCP